MTEILTQIFNQFKNIGAVAITDALLIPALIYGLMRLLAPAIGTPVVQFTFMSYGWFVVLFIVVDALMEPIRTRLVNPLLADLNL
jgi:hypothetical protein